ncbi:MAG: hypothetical protein ACRDDM_11040 [Paraclostridium sp.]
MDYLKKHFDEFTINTRIMPGLVIMLPVIIWGISKGIIDGNSLKENTVYLFMFTIFIVILSYYSRICGRNVEKKLFKKLGGMPTTIILRHSDNFIDSKTKHRYHKILNSVIKDVNIPENIGAELKNINSDDEYKSAVNWLRNNANDNRDKYPMVYNELKNYNFTRNLYGLKRVGLAIYFFVGVWEGIRIESFNIMDLLIKPYPEYLSIIIMIIGALVVMMIARKKNVKERAYDYAKALIETCEKLEDKNLNRG